MSYTFTQAGSEIQAILDRAEAGGQIDQDIAAKQDALTFDDAPISGSDNPVKSGGIYDAIQAGGATALAAFATDSVTPGDIVSFSDGADSIPVKSFVGSILPVQDLHGQSAPYPAGGGKNMLPTTVSNLKSINTGGTWSGNAYTLNGVTFTVNVDEGGNVTGVTVSGTSTAETAFNLVMALTYESATILSGCPTGGSTSTYSLQALNSASTSVLYNDTGSGASMASNTFGRVRIRIANGTNMASQSFYPMIRLSSVSDATFAPYSNICPISGWSGAEIYHRGKNLFNINATFIKNSANYSVSGDVLTVTSTVNSSASIRSMVMPITSDMVGKSIALSGTIGGSTPQVNQFRLRVYNDAEINSFYADFTNTAGASVGTVTSDMVGKFLAIVFYAPTTSGQSTTYTDVQIELSDTATDYEAYQGETILLTFGSTVYAGTITALGGGRYAIQPTHTIVDLGTLTWVLVSGPRFRASLPDMADATTRSIPLVCSVYQTIDDERPLARVPDCSIYNGGGGTVYLFVHDRRYADAATFNANVTGSVVYPLATLPDPIIVTAEDLSTLLGSNTVWLNCGAVTEMTYRADTALYVQKLIGGGSLSLSMAAPSPSLSLGMVGVLAEPEAAEPEQPEEVAEEPEQAEEE